MSIKLEKIKIMFLFICCFLSLPIVSFILEKSFYFGLLLGKYLRFL